MLKRGQWSVEELSKLRSHYGRRPLAQLARELRRTPETVRQRALRLFAGRTRVGALADPECVELRLMVGVAPLDAMALVLGRREDNIVEELRAWAATKRTGRFADWELAHLRSCYGSRPDWALRLVLGRTLAVIRRRARDLCLGKDRGVASVDLPQLEKLVKMRPQPTVRMPRWTSEELEVLERLYRDTPNFELAKLLGRSVKSVIAKANERQIKKSADRLRDMGRENVRIRHGRRSQRARG